MMNKKKTHADVPSDNMLLQMNHKSHIHSVSDESEQNIDEFDMGNVDDIMAKYESDEKKQKADEEFIKVLKTDDKLLNFFVENYNPGADKMDDEKFVTYEFSKFSEQGWSEDGKPLDKQVLSKKKAKMFANDIV